MKIELEKWEEPELHVMSADWAKWPKPKRMNDIAVAMAYESVARRPVTIEELLKRSERKEKPSGLREKKA